MKEVKKNLSVHENILFENEEMGIREAIFLKIDAYCSATGTTQEEIASRANVTSSTIDAYRNKRSRIPHDKLELLCRAIGCRWSDLDVDTGVKRNQRIERMRAMLDGLGDLPDEILEGIEADVKSLLTDSVRNRLKGKMSIF